MRKQNLVKAATVNAGTEVKIDLSTYTDEQAVAILNTIANMQGVTDVQVYVSWFKENAEGTLVESAVVDEDHSEDLQRLRKNGAEDWLANAADWVFEGQDYNERGDGVYTQEGCAYFFHFNRVVIEHTTGLDDDEFIAEVEKLASSNTDSELEVEPELELSDEYTEIHPSDVYKFLNDGHPVYYSCWEDEGYNEFEPGDTVEGIIGCYVDDLCESFEMLDEDDLEYFRQTGELPESKDSGYNQGLAIRRDGEVYSQLWVREWDGSRPYFVDGEVILEETEIDGITYQLLGSQPRGWSVDVRFYTRLFEEPYDDDDDDETEVETVDTEPEVDSRDEQIQNLQNLLEEANRQLAEKDKLITEKDKLIAEKDKQLAAVNQQLEEVNQQLAAALSKLNQFNSVTAPAKPVSEAVLASFGPYNRSRYSAPWAALVEQGICNFKERVAVYTGNPGEDGDLIITNPIDGAVYAFGQKDYRSKYGGTKPTFRKWDAATSSFIPCDKVGREVSL